MGRRLDLIEMFGIPEKIECGNCKKMSYPHGLSEYSDELVFVNGVSKVIWYCGTCEENNENEITLNISINNEKTYTAQEIQELLTLSCCHISGTHDPEHFSKREYICNDQIVDAFRNICLILKINPVVKHSENCGWCRDYPDKQKGDGMDYWNQPIHCARCGYLPYMHERESHKCEGFVPTTFETMLQYRGNFVKIDGVE